jgi:hypothetical protein
MSHIPFVQDADAQFMRISKNEFAVVVSKPTIIEPFDIQMYFSALVTTTKNDVTVTLRKSFESDIQKVLEHEKVIDEDLYTIGNTVCIHNTSIKKRKTLHRFFKSVTFREIMLCEMRHGACDDILLKVLNFLPNALSSSEVVVENDAIYVMDTRIYEDDTVVYTTNIYWLDGNIVVKTWRAFETLYIGSDNEHEYDSWLWAENYVQATVDDFEYIVNKMHNL